MARRIAKHGYFCLLPDLYYRLGALRFDIPRRNDAMSAVIRGVDAEPDQRRGHGRHRRDDRVPRRPGKVKPGPLGCVGHCMSGPFALAAAARFPRMKAAAALYGVDMVTDKPDSPASHGRRHQGRALHRLRRDRSCRAANVVPDAQVRVEAGGHEDRMETPGRITASASPAAPTTTRSPPRKAGELFDLWDRNSSKACHAILDIPGGQIHYEVHGSGYPVLLFAPGFLSSRIERWRTNPASPACRRTGSIRSPSCRNTSADRARRAQRRPIASERDAHRRLDQRTPAITWRCSIISRRALPRDGRVHRRVVRARAREGAAGTRVVAGAAESDRPCRRIARRSMRSSRSGRRSAQMAEHRSGAAARLSQAHVRRRFHFQRLARIRARCKIPMLLMPGDDVVHPAEISDELAHAPNVEIVRRGRARPSREARCSGCANS